MTTRNLVGAAAMKAVSNIDREELERQVSQCSGFVKMMCGVANNCAIQVVNMCRSKIEDIRDEKRGISLWDLCFSVVPRWNEVESDVDMSDPLNITFNADYRLDLVPLEIDFEHGPGYWEAKYRLLKSKIEKLISEKED